MLRKFIGREEELEKLESAYRTDRAELIILYGRRRIGKTELVKQFIQDKDAFYYLARQQRMELERQRFAKEISKQQDTYVEPASIGEMIQQTVSEQRQVYVIDEFPYWIQSDKTVASEMQHGWDELLKGTNTMLILLGSSVSSMEEHVLGRKSPLYGRRTGQLRIGPMPLKTLKEFFPAYDTESLFQTYGAIGTVPFYLQEFTDQKTVMENIEDTFLNKINILHEEAEILLREELRKPTTYFNIIQAVMNGATTYNEIGQKTGLSVTNIGRYLSILERLQIVKAIHPVTENKKRKNIRYKVYDNYFRFWLSYVYAYQSDVERNSGGVLAKVRETYSRYMGPVFEDICRKTVSMPRVGSWWWKEHEIDIVGFNSDTDTILFGECKWKDGVDAVNVVKALKRKAANVRWGSKKRNEQFVVFAKSFSQTGSVKTYTLEDVFEEL